MRTAAPLAVRRGTRGAAVLITVAGRFSASDAATMIGVIAAAKTVPRSQIIGTTNAAATAARLRSAAS